MPHKPVVLMVEDDTFFAEICTRHFTSHKFQTKAVKNFSEAEKKIKLAVPDIIIVDVALEEKAGFNWIKNLRADELTKKVPIVILTGLGDREEIIYAIESGANKYFLKSQITPHELAGQIKTLLTTLNTP